MFVSKKNDEYKAVSKMVRIISGPFGLKIPRDTEKIFRESNFGAFELWKNYRRYIFSDKNVSLDMEEVFAGLDVYTAETKLDSLLDKLKKLHAVPFRILGSNKRYLVSFIPLRRMKKLKKILNKYEGAFDSWFDLDINNMIKLPKAPKPEMVKVPPLSPNSKMWKSMEEIVRTVNTYGIEKNLAKMREELSKEHEIEKESVPEQVYWYCLLGAIESQYTLLQDDFEASDVIEDVSYITDNNLDLDEKIDYSEFYIPEDVGTYKALSILAEELEDHNIQLGLLESPNAKNGIISKKITVYRVLLIYNGDKNNLKKLFADCGGAIHFDYNDPERLAAPVRQTGVLINWGGPRLPSSDESY